MILQEGISFGADLEDSDTEKELKEFLPESITDKQIHSFYKTIVRERKKNPKKLFILMLADKTEFCLFTKNSDGTEFKHDPVRA